MINLSLSQKRSMSYSFIWMLFVIPSCVFSAQEHHILCSTPFSCGDQNDLSYPFWISGREDCGHPDFKLDCSGDFAEFNISSVKFRILEQNSVSRVIKLARSDYFGNSCPPNPPNAPFNENILTFVPGTELLTIYYDCQDFEIPPYVGEFECDDGKSYFATSNRKINGLRGSCNRNVSIPASGPLLNTLQNRPTPDNLHKALQEGFEVGLNKDCSMCIDSRGVCGYNKTLTSSGFVCYCIDEPHSHTCGSRNKGLSTKAKAGIAAGALGWVMLIPGFCLLMRRRKKTRSAQYASKDLPITSYSSRETSNDPMIQEDIVGRRKKTSNDPRRRTSEDSRQQYLKALIPLKHYSYVELEKITKSFAEVVGKGGFGTVYRGILCDGRSVAVKILKESQGNGEDFINEVASMSKTSHVNIVTLLGFCSEGSKKAIVYEFMENGSLDKFISSKKSSNMDWRELYKIALGVARGLEYLHHGCRTRIIHFDIKPQNVLLDDNLFPKVSDFGLAKLCEKRESILSLLDTRGTIGYIAPELFSRMYGRVSHKSDVYSYGMLLFEMIGGRNKPSTEGSASNPSSMYFPEWIYRDLEIRDNGRLIENGINNEEEEIARKMTLVGLWCIQSSPSDRPPMDRVVEMMEGNLNALEVPPRPVFQIPTAPLQESSTISEDISAYTEVCSINIA